MEVCQQRGFYSAGFGRFEKYDMDLERRFTRFRDRDPRAQIRDSILELFPSIPAHDLQDIVNHAFQKVIVILLKMNASHHLV